MRARAEMRARRRQIIGLALVLGLLGGGVIAAASGARRTESSYARYLSTVDAPTLALLEGGVPGAGLFYELDLEEVASYPEVVAHDVVSIVPVRSTLSNGVTLEPFDLGLEVGERSIDQRAAGRVTLVDGRLPRPDRTDEVAFGFAAAALVDVQIGDTVTMEFLDEELVEQDFLAATKAPPIARADATVVGFVASSQSFSAAIEWAQMFGTPAMLAALPDGAAQLRELRPIIAGGAAGLASFEQRVGAATGGAHLTNLQSESTKLVERGTNVQAVALALLALLLVIALALVAVQSVSRMVFTAREDARTLAALGMERRQRAAVQLIQTGSVGLLAAAVAVIAGILSAPLTIWGEARIMEGARFWVDPGVVAAAALALVGIAIIGGSPAVIRAVAIKHDAAASASGRRKPSWVVTALTSGGASPVAVSGARLAVERGRGRTASPVWTTIMSSAVGMAAMLAALLFAASLNHMLATPEVTGDFSDTIVGFTAAGDLEDAVVPSLERTDLVDGFAAGSIPPFWMQLDRDDRIASAPVLALDLTGDIEPVVLEGEWPDAPAEVALGSATMRAVGASVGDRIAMSLPEAVPDPVSVEVVGRAVFPSFTGDPNEPSLGTGIGMNFTYARDLFGDTIAMNLFPVRLAEGATRQELFALFPPDVTPAATRYEITLPDLKAFTDISSMPSIVAVVLVLLAVATLTHGVLTAIRRRRRDLATLKALGFGRGQVRRTVAWQATLLVLFAAIIAVPAGLLGGRWAWTSFADRVGVVPVFSTPAMIVGLLVPAALIVGNVIALVPGRAAARTSPAEVLRAE